MNTSPARTPAFPRWWLALMLVSGGLLTGRAQWSSQNLNLREGWNAVYLYVDCSHTNISQVLAAAPSIQEVWLWQPAPNTVQFTQNPAQPVDSGSQWKSWKRTDAVSGLNRLVGNAAYLVRSTNTTTTPLKGRPVPPRLMWTTTGLNLVGYPTVPVNPPTLDAFFSGNPAFRQALQVFYYDGIELDSGNPHELFNFMLASRPASRGEAFWMRAGDLYNAAYGPFEVSVPGQGFDFKDSISQLSFRIKNLHPTASTLTLRLLASESPPAGQPALSGTPPLLVRGELNPTNQTYGFTTLNVNGTTTRVLQPAGSVGSEVEIVLGINRHALNNQPGELLAGIVRLTDSLGFSQVDLPLAVTVGSPGGLWVGSASVSSVNAYLKSFQKDGTGAPITARTETNGPYVLAGLNTNAAPVTRPFPLRLILHSGSDGTNPTLLERVYFGFDSQTNSIVTRREVNLNRALLRSARRISAPHLPWTAVNTGWPFAGQLKAGQTLVNTVEVSYTDQSSNPFLHTYHPDHDGLDASFATVLPRGEESYTITRNIRLNVQPPAGDFSSLTASGQQLNGLYSESIVISGKGTQSRTFSVSGAFVLNRISTISTLTP